MEMVLEGSGSALRLLFRPNMNTRGRNRAQGGLASSSQDTAWCSCEQPMSRHGERADLKPLVILGPAVSLYPRVAAASRAFRDSAPPPRTGLPPGPPPPLSRSTSGEDRRGTATPGGGENVLKGGRGGGEEEEDGEEPPTARRKQAGNEDRRPTPDREAARGGAGAAEAQEQARVPSCLAEHGRGSVGSPRAGGARGAPGGA
jgi:hypothetical protein